MTSVAGAVKRVYVETFGCQMNESDTERLLGFLQLAGYEGTSVATSADLIVFNTCSVRDKAEQKLYSAIGRYRVQKEENPGLIIAVCGCVAQQEGARLLKKMRYLDLVFGPASIHRVKELLEEVSRKKRVVETRESTEIGEDEYPSFASGEVREKAFVSIMRGCDNFCAYCIVPYTRGREVSRASDAVIGEVTVLAASGVKEITLLGQNVNSYGKRSGGKEVRGATELGFTGLIKGVSGVTGIERVRFVTSHPKDISEELITLFESEPKLVRHLHLPLQSGSDAVLKRMGRGYTSGEYMEKIEKLKKLYSDMAFTTDIIVGFPGETDEDFDRTMDIIKQVRFDNIFSFKYSPRPGTPAADLPDQLPEEVKSKRLSTLQRLQKEISMEQNISLVGQKKRVFIEGRSRNDAMEVTGRTPCNRVVNLKAPLELKGSVIDVLITDAYSNSLRGRYLGGDAQC